jgi:hypothetical protein
MDARDPLKHAAPGIDELLRTAKHQTLLHGDAKLANFCFPSSSSSKNHSSGGASGTSESGSRSGGGDRDGLAVAAVDFQYTGWGVGVLDLYYCIGAFPAVEDLSR